MRKFKSKTNKSGLKYIIVFMVSFLCTLKLMFNNRSILLTLLLNESTKSKESMQEYLVTPSNLLYSGMNKIVSKNALNIINIEEDSFDYSKSKSEFISDPAPSENSSEPIVYIYNTHQTEEYDLKSMLDYSVKPNVMIASYILREKLNKKRIGTLVETNDIKSYLNKHNYKYNMSYHASEYFARKKQEEYPSIKYLIDVHRDSGSYDNTTLDINGVKYAKILYVVGLEHTPYENNKGFAEKLNEETESTLRGLSKGVSYKLGPSKYGVYNPNLNGKSVLIEIGGYENKIEEVNNTIEVLSKILEKIIKEETNA